MPYRFGKPGFTREAVRRLNGTPDKSRFIAPDVQKPADETKTQVEKALEEAPKPVLVFKVGDKLVYPQHGVVEVISIEEKQFGAVKTKCYILRLLGKDDKIFVPVDKTGVVRQLLTLEEVQDVFDVLGKKELVYEGGSWSRRFRIYQDMVKSGDFLKMAAALRELELKKIDCILSFGERELLAKIRSSLITEIALVRAQSEGQVWDDIRSSLNFKK